MKHKFKDLLKPSYIGLFILDGILGTIIASMSFYHYIIFAVIKEQPEILFYYLLIAPFVWIATLPTNLTSFLTLLPFMLSTLVLTPFLIDYLLYQKKLLAPRSFYKKSVWAGIVFGFAACPISGFFMGFAATIKTFIEMKSLSEGLTSLGGPGFMFIIGALIFPIFFFFHILIGGAIFGIVNGLWLRASSK